MLESSRYYNSLQWPESVRCYWGDDTVIITFSPLSFAYLHIYLLHQLSLVWLWIFQSSWTKIRVLSIIPTGIITSGECNAARKTNEVILWFNIATTIIRTIWFNNEFTHKIGCQLITLITNICVIDSINYCISQWKTCCKISSAKITTKCQVCNTGCELL